jgi:hypothetical protein
MIKNYESSVGIVLGYGLDDQGSRVQFPAGAGNFSLHHHVQNSSGVHPASYPMGTRGSFPGGKVARSMKLTTHLHLVLRSKIDWSYTSTPQYAFMAWCLVTHRNNFTFTFAHKRLISCMYLLICCLSSNSIEDIKITDNDSVKSTSH